MALASSTGKGNQQQPPQHFFRVVLHPLDQGLRIPAGFWRRYGDSLEKVVVLKAPDGVEWLVECCDIDGESWLRKGWKEFGEFYSIKDYYFLVFKYEGNSRFSVTIFDTTASEIDYPVKLRHQRRVNTAKIKCEDEDEDGDNDSVEILEVKKTKIREHPDRVIRKGIPNPGLSYSIVNGRRLRRRINGDDDGSGEGPDLEKLSTWQRDDVESECPSFELTVRKSHTSAPYQINIPSFFIRGSRLGRNYRENYNLRVPGEKRAWPVCVCIDQKQGRIYGDGWKRFAVEKRLQVGEVCTFELVKSGKTLNFYRNSPRERMLRED